MRSIAAWLLVNAAFVAVNALGALVIFGLFRAGQVIAPAAMGSPWLTYPLGIIGVAATLAVAFWVARFIARQPRGRGNAQG